MGGAGFGLGGFGAGMPQGSGMGAGMGGIGVPPAGSQAAGMDLACASGPRAAGWSAAKKLFRALYDGEDVSPLVLPSAERMSATLDSAMAELKAVGALAPDAGDECGLGRLCLQLMSIAAVEEPAALAQLFQGLEQLASPVLTMLLDVPLAALGQAGWPLFGLLSTINLRKSQIPEVINSVEVDGLADDAGLFFQSELLNALQAGNAEALNRVGAFYLQLDASGSALAPLTALASQTLAASTVGERLAFLDTFQAALKQVIGSAAELDIALSTRWPLWGMTQMSLDALSS
mmetsp:Transcript_42079/g.121564  ORF Transcript_42079/g.121564 Transcript_42079/m.121564 type:complete len:290 (+) Transcript_42079:3-872(+)